MIYQASVINWSGSSKLKSYGKIHPLPPVVVIITNITRQTTPGVRLYRSMAVSREEPHEKQAKKIDVDLAREIRRQGRPAHGAAAHVMPDGGCFKSVQALRSTMPAPCRLI